MVIRRYYDFIEVCDVETCLSNILNNYNPVGREDDEFLVSNYKRWIDSTFDLFHKEIRSNAQRLSEPIRSHYLGRIFESLEIHLLKLPTDEELQSGYSTAHEAKSLEQPNNSLGEAPSAEFLQMESRGRAILPCYEICRAYLVQLIEEVQSEFKPDLEKFYKGLIDDLNTDTIRFKLTVPELAYLFGLMKRTGLIVSTRDEIASVLSKSFQVEGGENPSTKSILNKLGSESGPPSKDQVQTAHIQGVRRAVTALLAQITQDEAQI